MGDAEIQALKEDITEIKGDVKEVKDAVARLHLLMVENYVTRNEFEAYKEQEIRSRRWWVTFVIGAATVVITIINMANHFFNRLMAK